MTASSRIREAVADLPERQKATRWISDSGQIVPDRDSSTYWADGNILTMNYVALMDPAVGLALADLLDAIPEERGGEPAYPLVMLSDIVGLADILRVAITRGAPDA